MLTVNRSGLGCLYPRLLVQARSWLRACFAILLICAGGQATGADAFSVTAMGAQYKDLNVGSGATAEIGDEVTIHFVSWLDEDGQRGAEIFNSRSEGRPVTFVVGTDKVMPAWNDAVIGMQEGGKRIVLVPPVLGYGEAGVEGIVPPEANLVLILEIIALTKSN
ncbi:MAG TPA: FKBP-type peptidyl-prolyl cis-trans isomerase [Pseudomonadales bacterium]